MTIAAGSRLGPYEVLSLLGAGGMGEVWKARDPRLEREVAIKVLPASLSRDPDRLRRFEQEGKAAGMLNHPNVTAVYDIGVQDGVPYVVSELLDGETLSARLAGGALAPRKALGFALQIAHGLAAAHDKGIVHRDLKPANIFVTKDGRVKILDFGLAKLTEPEAGTGSLTDLPTAGTESGVVLGTPGYMSPEQVRGRRADPRSDIFSFGAILYEMLSGKRAFHGDTPADTMSAILVKEPPELSATGGPIPPGLDRIVRHCLEKDLEQRFHSAHDLAFDLEALSDALPSSAGAVSPRAQRRRGRVYASIGGAAAALLIIGGLVLLRRTDRGFTSARGPGVDRKSIAVLPFQNLSPDPENAFFADGMTEDVLTQLAKIGDLKVISRTSVMRYKDTKKPLRTIAEELNVATVLEGSVRRVGNRVRIVGQLIDARTDEHLWAETYDRQLEDVFAIQSDVAQRIAASLQATLSPAEKRRIEERPTRSLLAYDHYLRAREYYNLYRKADNETAIELFQKALDLDPGFALAYAGLGDAYAQRVLRFGFPQTWLDTSLEASRKAVALAPGTAEGHKALGLAYQVKGAYREAFEANRKAVELSPNHDPAINNLAAILNFLGRFDEGMRWGERAFELGPTSAITAVVMGSSRAALEDANRAEALFRRALELQPDLAQAHVQLIRLYLRHRRDREALEQARNALQMASSDSSLVATAEAELLAGDPARARQLFEQFQPIMRGVRLSRTSDAGVETYLAYMDLRSGRRSEAYALLTESVRVDRGQLESGNQDWTVCFDMACVHALRSEKDEAFRWLDRAVEAGWRGWPLGTREPLLDSLRNDPRLHRIEAHLEELVGQMRRRAGLK